jgi:hypothetical protein
MPACRKKRLKGHRIKYKTADWCYNDLIVLMRHKASIFSTAAGWDFHHAENEPPRCWGSFPGIRSQSDDLITTLFACVRGKNGRQHARRTSCGWCNKDNWDSITLPFSEFQLASAQGTVADPHASHTVWHRHSTSRSMTCNLQQTKRRWITTSPHATSNWQKNTALHVHGKLEDKRSPVHTHDRIHDTQLASHWSQYLGCGTIIANVRNHREICPGEKWSSIDKCIFDAKADIFIRSSSFVSTIQQLSRNDIAHGLQSVSKNY